MFCTIDDHQEAIDLVCLDTNCQTKGSKIINPTQSFRFNLSKMHGIRALRS